MSTTSEELAIAIQSLSLCDQVDSIDSILDEIRPRKRSKPSIGERRQVLEDDFLKPSRSFSTEWLNKLQQYVPFFFENEIACACTQETALLKYDNG